MKAISSYKLFVLPLFFFILLISGCKKDKSSNLPLLATTELSAVNAVSAKSGGDIFSDGGDAVTARGVCWNTVTQPTISNSLTMDGQGTGSFTSTLTGLTNNTTYYVRAYATNANGTAYGSELSFTTLGTVINSSVVTLPASNITSTGATLNGSIDASFNITDASFEYGVATDYGTSVPATLKNVRIVKVSKSVKGAKAQVLIAADVTGLAPYTSYHFRAEVVNTSGSSFGSDVAFTTPY